MVELKNGHIHKNLTKKKKMVNPWDVAWNAEEVQQVKKKK